MAERPVGTGRGAWIPPVGRGFLLVCACLLLAGPGRALTIVPGSLSVSRSVDSGASWIDIPPGQTVKVGDQIRVLMTLENDTGYLGNLCVAGGPTPPEPGLSTCADASGFGDCLAQNNGFMDSGLSGMVPGQLWVWPVIGKCPNGLYPSVVDSPVELVSAEGVSSFAYNGNFLDTVEAYDPGTDSWSTKTPMPTARARFGAAAAGGKIYAIGGRSFSGVLALNEEYDPATDTWTTRAPMPTPREAFAMTAANGKIYAIGGRNASGVVLDIVEEYDPATNTWSTRSPMLEAMYGHAAVTMTPFGSDMIYVAGGYDGTLYGLIWNSYSYDPGADSWSSISGIWSARGDLAAASDGTYGWFVGGTMWWWDYDSTEGYDPVTDSWNGGSGMTYPRLRLATAVAGGKVYAVGGAIDNGWGWLPDFPVGYTATLNNEEFDSFGWSWTPKADMPTPREWLGAAGANVAGTDYVFAIGGFTGYRYDIQPGSPNNTARIAWTFTARTEWVGLDFSVFAMDVEDGYLCGSAPWQGSFYDCSIPPSGGFAGDNTLKTIFADFWGAPLIIEPKFAASSHAEVFGAGTRPPGVAYLGDTIRVYTSITNTGADDVLNGIDACSAHHPYSPGDSPNGAPAPPKGNVCFVPQGAQGACSANNTQPGSPSLPDPFLMFENKTYTWDYYASGYGFAPGFPSCGVGGMGSGSVYFDVVIQGAKSEAATLYVQPAPLRITATAWIDPDGPAGPLTALPLRQVGGAAGYYYYMGQESINATFIYSNTSTVYSFDVEPGIAVGGFDPEAFMMVAGPVPSGALLLAPGQSATVMWAFTRTPGGSLDVCAPSLLGQVVDFTTAVRGSYATQSVLIKDVPFHSDIDSMMPLPEATAGGVPAGTRNLTFDVPSTVATGNIFTVNLYARNVDARTFVMDANASFFLTRSSYGGEVQWSTSPAPPPVTWLAGQQQTMQWQYMATGAGELRWSAGLDFSSVPPPCQLACFKGSVIECNNTDGFYPWKQMFCTLPGFFSTTLFTASPPLSCDDAGQVVVLRLGVKNTSSIYCTVVTGFCDKGYPDAVPTDMAPPYNTAPPPYPAVRSPQPLTPFTILPGGSQLVTWYLDAVCPPTPGGLLSFGCFSGTNRMVEGYTVNCGTGAIINPADGADWGGAAPTVNITYPADLSCSIWTDNYEYSVGQVITIFFSVSNQGGDTLSSFGLGTWPTLFMGAGLGPPMGPVPAPPATYPGSGVCTPPPPPYPANETFSWQFQTLSKGRAVFTATAGGWDAECGTWKMTSCSTPAVTIASAARLACSPPDITPVVTLSVSCTGCPPVSLCDPATGSGCLNVAMDLSNFGDIAVGNVTVSQSNAFPALRVCGAGSCTTPAPAVLASLTPPPDPLGSLASGTVVWRYTPTGLTGDGCVQVHVEAFGTDNATGVTLYCDGWTGCAAIKARYPMQLSLVSVPTQIAPGQEFPVQVSVYNPGETPASLQSGEPAFQFFLAATGAKVTDEYDVLPPPPVVIQPGERRVVEVTVMAHRNAQAGTVEIKVATGSQFVAVDVATGLPFPAVDAGGPVATRLINLQNKLVVVGNNQTRILRQPVVLNYQIADAGRRNGKTTLRVYTITGELVRTLVDKAAAIEEAEVPWDGRNDAGQMCASGIYLARLESPTYSKVVKVAILK